MRKSALAVALAGGVAFVVAADVAVGFREVGGIGVEADGAETVDGKLLLSPEATFYKTGAGTLTVPSAAVDSPNGYSINVLKGKMVLSGASAEVSVPSAPAVVAEKAALWLDASTLTEGAAVSTWGDVRGEGYASAVAKQRISKVDQTEVDPPVVATTNGSRGVYFGGKSGKWMSFRQNGSAKTFSKTHHFFVVHSVYQTYGAVLGHTAGSRGHGLLTTAANNGVLTTPFESTSHYLITGRGDLDWCNFQGRFFLDGRFFDPRTSQISRGASLLEGDLQAMPETFDAIYRNYFETYSQETPGGDYVHEVLLFTCPLTEAERLDVERYLLDKWRLPQTEMLMKSKQCQIAHPPRGTGLVKVETNATVDVAVADGETTAPFQFDGTGAVTKKGAGTLLIGGGAARPFAGSFELEEGDLLVHGGAMPPVTVRAGEAWDAASWPASRAETIAGDAASGIRVSKTATSALHASKTGAGELLVAGVEAGTGRINVEKGVLHFAAKECDAVKPDADIGADEVEIPNHSFEMPFPWYDAHGRSYNWTSQNGWKNDAGGGYVQMVTESCANWKSWSAQGYSIPDGTNALMIVMSGYGYTSVTVPRAGTYEVSYYATSRYGSRRAATSGDFGKRSQVNVMFNERRIGSVQVNEGAFTRFRHRFTVTESEAGTAMKFGFKSLQSYSDNCMIIDDVHIRAVAEAARADVVKVPGGDFEDSAYYNPDGTKGSRFSSAFCRFMTSPDWNLTIAEDAPSQNPTNGYVAICTAGTPTLYNVGYTDRFTPFYPQADGRCGSGVLGFIGSFGTATTKNTFKLPAGKWLLRAALMENGGAYNAAFGVGEKAFGTTPVKVEAKLTRNGQVSSLGTISTSSHLMQSCTWPTVIEVAEEEDVLLSLTQTVASGVCLLDDLEFVPATAGDPERNLFPNADFERSVSYSTWKYATADKYSSYTGRFTYVTDSWAFGLDVVNGDVCMRLHNDYGIYETVDFPGPGLYRITIPAHPRPDDAGMAHKELRASVKLDDGTDMEIFRQPLVFNPSFLEYSYLFRMSETGPHEVRIVGIPIPSASVKDGVNQANRNTMIDNIRLTKVEETAVEAPQVAEDTALTVKAGAKLGLDYEGTVTVRSLKLGDTYVHGTVKASDYPDYLTGMGQIEIKPKGTLILVR